MKYVSDYLDFIEVSRKKVKPGDIFCFRIINQGPYFYGRVIMTDAVSQVSSTLPQDYVHSGVLIYVYKYSSKEI